MNASAVPTLPDATRKIFYLVLKHAKSIDIDFDAVTTEGGYKNLNVARTIWAAQRGKFLKANDAAATPSAPSKKRKAGSDGEGDAAAPAAKKPRGRKAKAKKEEDEEEDGEHVVKKEDAGD